MGGGEEREREREGEEEETEREEREKLKLKVETLDTLLREERDSRLSTLSATPQRERELGTTRRWRRTTAAAPRAPRYNGTRHHVQEETPLWRARTVGRAAEVTRSLWRTLGMDQTLNPRA